MITVVIGTSASGQDAGKELFQKMQRALGGAEKIAAIRDFEETVNAEAFTASGRSLGSVRKRTRWIAPNHLRIDQVGPGSTYVLYVEGSSGWEILPDQTSRDKTTSGPIDLVGEELQFAKQYLSGLIFKKWLADRQPGYTISSPSSNVARITDNGGQVTDIRLDSKTWLPLDEHSPRTDPAKAPLKEMRFDGWLQVGGVKFPTSRTNYHDGARLAAITTDHIYINAGLRIESLEAKPADSLPRLSD